MTDARLRGEWVNAIKFDGLSDVAWRAFTGALMWSAENGTDGHIPQRYLKRLHPDGERPAAFDELVSNGIWERSADGFMLVDWDGAMGQSSALQVETYKANWRKRQSAFREKTRRNLAVSIGFEPDSPTPATRDVTSSVTRDVGKGKGEGKGSRDIEKGFDNEKVNLLTGEVTEVESTSTWHVATIPTSPHEDLSEHDFCSVCSNSLVSKESRAIGLCRKGDAEHVVARGQSLEVA